MKIISTAAALAYVGVTSATKNNPFAHKTSPNTPRASYVNKLMANARPTSNSKLSNNRRFLDGAAYDDVDITSYSLKFEKCQYIKQYAEEYNANVDTVLETKHFVIFRLCPDNECTSTSCSENYGEYIVDMETYLESTLKHMQEEQEMYCQACEECAVEGEEAANDDADDAARRLFGTSSSSSSGRRNLSVNVNCSTCYNECQNIENMEDNGYVDAAEYLTCEKVYENQNNGFSYYAGPTCDKYGTRIKVGLFTDENCEYLAGDLSIEKYLKNDDGYNVKLSYHLLKKVQQSEECLASCTAVNENDDDGGDIQLAEVCEDLYYAAGKCENPHGFKNGIDYSNSNYYEVQAANEESVCDFIATIQSGQYTQTGDIVITGGRTTFNNNTQMSGGQKFALTFFVIGTMGLTMYAAMLYRKITKSKKAMSDDVSVTTDIHMA